MALDLTEKCSFTSRKLRYSVCVHYHIYRPSDKKLGAVLGCGLSTIVCLKRKVTKLSVWAALVLYLSGITINKEHTNSIK